MFCEESRLGLKSLNLPNEVLCQLESEEVLSTINEARNYVNGELSREEVGQNLIIDSDESLLQLQ